MRRSRFLLVFSIAAILVAGVWVTLAVLHFRGASHRSATDTAFGILLGKESYMATEGSIRVPIDGHPWGTGPQGDAFEDAVNELPGGSYRYFKYEVGRNHRFIVVDQKGDVVASGHVRFDWRKPVLRHIPNRRPFMPGDPFSYDAQADPDTATHPDCAVDGTGFRRIGRSAAWSGTRDETLGVINLQRSTRDDYYEV